MLPSSSRDKSGPTTIDFQPRAAPAVSIMTQSTVRPDPKKRSKPMSLATFLDASHAIGEGLVREALKLSPDSEITPDNLEHLHLIGDASMLAVEVFKSVDGDYQKAVNILRETFVYGKHHEYEDELQPAVREQIILADIFSGIFGIRDRVRSVSAIEFLRENRTIAQWVVDSIGRLYNGKNFQEAVDMADIDAAVTGIEPGIDDKGVELRPWQRLFRQMVPTRLRAKDDEESPQDVAQSAYGFVEAMIASGHIAEGPENYYISYSGPAGSDRRDPGVIPSMKIVAMANALETSNRPLVRDVHERLILEKSLNGVGFRRGRANQPYFPTDPFTMDWPPDSNGSNGEGPVMKLPLLFFKNGDSGKLRYVRKDEFEEAVRSPDGGLDKARRFAWRRQALPLLDAYFWSFFKDYVGDTDNQRISKDLPDKYSGIIAPLMEDEKATDPMELVRWFAEVHAYVRSVRSNGKEPAKSGRKDNDEGPLLPCEGKLSVAAALVEIMSRGILEEYEKEASGGQIIDTTQPVPKIDEDEIGPPSTEGDKE